MWQKSFLFFCISFLLSFRAKSTLASLSGRPKMCLREEGLGFFEDSAKKRDGLEGFKYYSKLPNVIYGRPLMYIQSL